jgi:membrane fusion protein (multidrug efflux system)
MGVFLFFGYKYIDFRNKNAVSDAAFIKSEQIATLSFKISGKVIKTFKKEFDEVKKGDILALIDTQDYEVAKKGILSQIKALNSKLKTLKIKKNKISKQLNLKIALAKDDKQILQKKIEALKYNIAANKSNLDKLKKDKKRLKKLRAKNLVSIEKFDEVSSGVEALQNKIKALKSELSSLKISLQKADKAIKLAFVSLDELKELQSSIDEVKENKNVLLTKLQDIENKISYATLKAPFNGVIAKKFITAPKVVNTGYPIYSIVDNKNLYCEVLLSEKKMQGIKVGSKATIEVEAVKEKFKGEVQSIAPVSASTFSLVPRDIASGEFTKLDQRFIIKIKLNKINNLRAGMGASVAIARD